MRISLTTALATTSIIAACGGNGGGGGSSITSGGGSSITSAKIANLSVIEGEDQYGRKIVDKIGVSENPSDLIKEVGIDRYGNLDIDEPSIAASKWGVTGYLDTDYFRGSLYFAYVDYDGNNGAIAGHFTPEDYEKFSSDQWIEHSSAKNRAEAWEWKNVNYGYVVVNGANILDPQKGENGTIKKDGSQWSADFGKVELSGEINGFEVSGVAKLDDMTGEFKGIDGFWKAKDVDFGNQYYDHTVGAFAGDNGSESAFAGGWYDGDLHDD